MAIILPELPYAYDALEPYVDAETMTLHHDKHHATYVANVNAALEKHPEIGEDLVALWSDVEKIPADIRQAVINNGGGHLNHALFWELMTPEKTEISAELLADIEATFGSFDAFKDAFSAAAATRFGSGWAWLVVNKEGKLEVISTTAMFAQTISRHSLTLSTGTRLMNCTKKQKPKKRAERLVFLDKCYLKI
ncbi:superoxide dismutase [Streptococcus hyointestinalis]